MVIFHALRKSKWEEVKKKEYYGEEYIKAEGFIHSSPIEYIVKVANYNFRDVNDLVLLCIDTDKVESTIKWEDLDGCGRKYPHIYGLLNLNSVIEVVDFKQTKKGYFYLPSALLKYVES